MADVLSDVDAVVARLRAAGCVFAEDEAALLIGAAPSAAALATMIERRTSGVPLEHVVGFAEFCGLRIEVDEGVFVPRQRTRLLVRGAAALVAAWPQGQTAPVVVDLACGSGAVGAAVATRVPGIALHAVDIEAAAVRCARRNLAGLGGRVYRGDLFDPLPEDLRGRVAVLVANVPYVPSAAVDLMPAEARDHEPLVALDGGADGLDVLRRVAGAAPEWLAPGGHVLFEIGTDQIVAARAALAAAGLAPTVTHDEDLSATVVTGRRAPG